MRSLEKSQGQSRRVVAGGWGAEGVWSQWFTEYREVLAMVAQQTNVFYLVLLNYMLKKG